MPEPIINGGLLPSPPRQKDYIAGAVTGVPDDMILPGGDWRPYRSEPHEMQLRYGRDFLTCTDFAATDTVEALMFKLFGTRVNYSDRALAIMSGLTPTGNSLWAVAEAIRTKGLVLESTLPWTAAQDTHDKFMAVTPEEKAACDADGAKWLVENEFGWEWVYDDFGRGMRWALERSPLFAAGLYAAEASKDADGIYHTDLPNSPMTTHAFVLLNQTPDAIKDIDDSYATQVKRLASDFRVPIGMRFHIAKKQPNQPPMYYPPKNSKVVVIDAGERLMYVGGETIYKDDTGKIQSEVQDRNSKEVPGAAYRLAGEYPVVHVNASQIAHLKRVNLKGEPA